MNIVTRGVRIVVAGLAFALLPAFAGAQEPVRSFDQLNARLAVGDTIYVTDTLGRESTGKIRNLGPTSLTLDVGGPETIQADAVSLIRERGDKPLVRSLLYGAIAGGVAGAVIGGADCAFCGKTGELGLLGGGVGVVIGAGIGAGIGALIPNKMRVVYQAPGASPRARFSVAPLITPHRTGVAAAFSF